MRRLLTATVVAAALVTALAGCSADASTTASDASGSGPTTATTRPSAPPASLKPATTKPTTATASQYPAAAKEWVKENICIAKAPSCKNIKGYGMVGGYALVAYTNIYPDGDAAAAAQPICSWLLGYIINEQPSADAVSSDAFIYGSTGSRIAKCHTPVDRG